MKVLEYPAMTWSAEAVCAECKARLLLEIADVKFESFNKYYVVCPVCHAWVYARSDIPWFVKRFASGGHVGWPPGEEPRKSSH